MFDPNNHLQFLKYPINSVKFAESRATLNVAALYFENPGLVFDQFEKVSVQYLHLLKTENVVSDLLQII